MIAHDAQLRSILAQSAEKSPVKWFTTVIAELPTSCYEAPKNGAHRGRESGVRQHHVRAQRLDTE
jgi:hypothetical protein